MLDSNVVNGCGRVLNKVKRTVNDINIQIGCKDGFEMTKDIKGTRSVNR